jgi:gamma-glutamyltranspeptidase/glutathione hydrolase
MRNRRPVLTLVCAALLTLVATGVACAQPRATLKTPVVAKVFAHGVVAADHPAASEAGAEILRQGGNVVDAAVATSFALSVVRPESCGIGGGGFMVIWNAEQQSAVALDYRERAPERAQRDMYVAADNAAGDGGLSRTGALAIAVPGNVAGLCQALEAYGTLDLDTVLAPAIRLARDGVAVDEHFRQVQANVLKEFAQHAEYQNKFQTLWKDYLNGGVPWEPGDTFRSPQLRVLELIAAGGRDAFYRGPVAESMLAEIKRGGGIITAQDLTSIQPVIRKPLRAEFAGFDILTMPPPSSGGVALIETLNILSAYQQQHGGAGPLDRSDPDDLHVFVEALKHAFADRAEYLGDTDFAEVPIERLIDPAYAEALARKIDPAHTLPREAYGRFLAADDAGTSHFSVIDARGNAVACTETINTAFGSFVVEPNYGIVLNNEMDDFAAVPGKPNAFGLIQSSANAVEPGKKPLSSMTPTIAVRDGQAVYALGGSGGPMIISATLQVLLNLIEDDLSPEAAVSLPRVHHQWIPEVLLAEPGALEVAKSLKARGHAVFNRSGIAATQAVSRNADGLQGGSDPRKGGRPAGY